MKRIILASFMLLLLSASSTAQWYTKKYQVSDINDLSIVQLQESLKESNNSIYYSLGAIGIGGLFLLGGILYEVNDESPFLEQVIGQKGMSYFFTGLGVGIAVGGTISTFAFLGRSGRIRSAIKRNYPVTGYMNISPRFMYNKYTRTTCPGLSLTITF